MGLWLGVWMLAAALPAQVVPPANELKRMTVEQLMNLQVNSVSKHPERLFEAASAIQVVTGEEIRRSGARSLPEALRLASNLEVAQIDARQWAITARGFNNVFADKMLVLVDGRSIYTPLYAGVYWDVQDVLLEDLDRIEVISGPGATQWGANAVNGVINITTKSTKDTLGGLVVAGGGDLLEHDGAVRYGGRAGDGVTYRVYGKSFARDESRRLDGRGAGDNWRMAQGGFRLDADAANNAVLTVQGDVYSSSFGRAGPDDISARGHNLLGRWARPLGDGGSVQLQAYYDHSFRAIPMSFTQTLDVYDLDFQHRWHAAEQHHLTWGGSFHAVDDDIVNTPANAFLPPHVTRESFSVFVQDEIALGERWRVTGGTKLDHNVYTGYEVEPGVRAAWFPSPQQTVWAALSRAVRTPSRIDRDLYSPATPPYRVSGGSNVISEKLIAAELGYRAEFADDLIFSVATFYNDYDDLRSLESLDPPRPFPVIRSSGLRGHSQGAELTLEWRPAKSWRLHAGYTELRVHTEPQPGNTDVSSDRNIARDPNHQFVLRSLLDLPGGFELDATARVVAQIRPQSVPGYAELDLRLGWNPSPGWSISVAGRNLLHDRHGEFNARGGRREIPRSVYGQVAWRF